MKDEKYIRSMGPKCTYVAFGQGEFGGPASLSSGSVFSIIHNNVAP